MLTVKWIYERDGLNVEHVFEADRVTSAFRTDGALTNCGAVRQVPPQIMGRDVHGALVVLDGAELAGRSFDCGKVYVMNEAGRTVASYQLGQPGTIEIGGAIDERGPPGAPS